MPAYYDAAHRTWYVKFRYTDWTGASKMTTKRGFKTKREAKEYETSFKRSSTESPEMTMKDLCDKYIDTIKGRVKSSTYRLRKGIINNYILPKLGGMKLSNITKQTIIEWQNWLMGQTRKDDKPLSGYTIRARNSILNMILNHAVKMDWLKKSPATNIPSVGATTKRLKFWEKTEYDRFIRAGEEDARYEYYRLCFDVLFYSGLRIAEFRGLGRDSVDFEKNRLVILHAKNAVGEKTTLKNSHSFRSVPMPQSIMTRLRNYMNSLADIPECGMFTTLESTLRQKMKVWADKAGLPYITLHGLRHSHVSYLISLGIPITTISKRIGHNSPKVTLDVYSHLYESDAVGVADILEKFFNVGQNVVK